MANNRLYIICLQCGDESAKHLGKRLCDGYYNHPQPDDLCDWFDKHKFCGGTFDHFDLRYECTPNYDVSGDVAAILREKLKPLRDTSPALASSEPAPESSPRS